MAEFPVLHLWTDAYLGDTMHLTTLENGAYLLLLINAWRRPNCDLPDDDKMLAAYARMPMAEWVEIRETIMAFWKYDGRSKVWRQKKLTSVRDYARKKSQSQADKAAKRWRKKKNDGAAGEPQQSRGYASESESESESKEEEESENPLPNPSQSRARTREAQAGWLAGGLESDEDWARHLAGVAHMPVDRTERLTVAIDQVATWRNQGVDLAAAEMVILRMYQDRPEPSTTLGRFNSGVMSDHERRQKQESDKPKRPTRPVEPVTQVNGEEPLCCDIRKRLLERIGPRTYTSWFQTAHLSVVVDQLQVEMPSRFMSDWCKNNLGETILSLLPQGIQTLAFTVAPPP